MADQVIQPAIGTKEGDVKAPVDQKTDVKVPSEPMYILKVNGKEEKVPLSKIIERAQKSEGAEAAMQKAAQIEKAFTNFASLVKTPQGLQQILSNPALGVDKKALLRGMLSSNDPDVVDEAKKYIFHSQVVPTLPEEQRAGFLQQKELEELRAMRTEQEAEKKRQLELQKAQEAQKGVQAAFQQNLIDIRKAISTEGLPETEPIIARIARYILVSRRTGKPLSAAESASRVKADLQTEWQSRLLSAKDDDELLSIIPEDTARKINAALMKRLKGEKKGEVKNDSKKPLTPEEKRKWLKQLERGAV